MTLTGTRFGAIEFDSSDIIDFPDGVIGFEAARRFVLVAADEPFRWLQSLDTPSLAFLLADPDPFVPNYAPEIPREASDRISLSEATPYFVWVTANVPPGRPREMTLNLAGPIVVNAESRIGRQIVLEDDAYTIRYRAFAREPRSIPALAA